jgi:hypothetical protein
MGEKSLLAIPLTGDKDLDDINNSKTSPKELVIQSIHRQITEQILLKRSTNS